MTQEKKVKDLKLEAWLDNAVELDELLTEAQCFVSSTIAIMGSLVREHMQLRREYKDLNKKYGLLLQARYYDKVRHGEVKNGEPMKALS